MMAKIGKTQKTEKLTFYLEAEVDRMLRLYATINKLKISDAINEILRAHLEKTKVPAYMELMKD